MQENNARTETPRKDSNGSAGRRASKKEAGSTDRTDLQGSIQQSATELSVDVKKIATQQFSKRAHRYADELGSAAKALRLTGAQLNKGGMVATYMEKAAGQLERASRFIEEARPGQILETVEGFARRRPWVFIGSAFAAGLLGARFLRSSAQHTRAGS